MVTSIYEALRLLGPGEGQAPGDQELLDRYRRGGDDGAFAALLRRHGGMVWGVCRRLLPRRQDAEDAFQATFLVFARKAASIGRGHLLGNWLYGVAYRTALRARRSTARWENRRAPLLDEPAVSASDAEHCDLPALIDEELNRLPEKYRVPLVLCCLEGMTKEEAARSAGVPEGTLSSRLARGRDLLRRRLTRRGVACTAPPVAALLAGEIAFAAAPPLLSVAVAASSASPAALELTEGVLRAMWIYRLKVVFVSLVACLALVGAGAVVLGAASGEPADPSPQGGAQQPPRPGVFPAAPKGPAVNPAPVPFGRQWQEVMSGQEQPLRTVIRTEAEWRKLWDVLLAPAVGKPPLPKVDFAREMLLAVGLGQRTSGGYLVTITRIVQTPEGLTAYVRETKPKPNTPAAGVLTHPYHVVAVPAFRGKVTFLDESDDKAGAVGKGQKATPVAVVWNWDGQSASQQLPLRTAVRTQAEWQKLWRLAQGNAKPVKPAPKIDFTRHMMLATFMGERPCPGFNVRITHVLKTERGLTVHVRETEPPADAFDKQVLTSPCHFALVPVAAGEVTFVDEPAAGK